MIFNISIYAQSLINDTNKIKTYIYISHTRSIGTNEIMDNKASVIDYSNYDMTLIGGDITYDYTQIPTSIDFIDSIFHLSSNNTLLSLGNHEYTDLNIVLQHTGKPSFYAFWKDNITFLVLDTQDSLSNIIGDQLQLVKSVTDTIQNSKFLIILHHKLIWLYGNNVLKNKIDSVANGKYGDCFYCTNPNNFYQDVYPLLQKVRERKIGVICIAGDIGFKVKQFEFMTPDSIFFLASGIDAGDINNKVLILENNISNSILSWNFINIETLTTLLNPINNSQSCIIYPLPINNEFYIIIKDKSNSYILKLYDIMGNEILIYKNLYFGKNYFEEINLQSGLYFYTLIDNKKELKAAGKIIVKRN